MSGEGPPGARPTACLSSLHPVFNNTLRLHAITLFLSLSLLMFTQLVRYPASFRG